MSRAQAESVIKNIIREIAQECANKGQAVSETLVAFMVRCHSGFHYISFFFVDCWLNLKNTVCSEYVYYSNELQPTLNY